MLCRRRNVSSRTRMALQPGRRVLRSFVDARDARDAGVSKPVIAVTPKIRLRTHLQFDLHAPIRRAPFFGVVSGDVATGALGADTNERAVGEFLFAEIVTYGDGAIAGEQFVDLRATQFVGATANLD